MPFVGHVAQKRAPPNGDWEPIAATQKPSKSSQSTARNPRTLFVPENQPASQSVNPGR